MKAEALNGDYLTEEKWRNNSNVTWESVDTSANGRSLSGLFGYYMDDEMCLYTYCSLTGDLLANSRDSAKLVFSVTVGNETYAFAADRDGMCDNLSDTEARLFQVETNFDGAAHGVFICAIAYLGKADSYRADVSFYANRSIPLLRDIPVDRPVTTKPEKTTAAKATTEKTTKPAKETTTKASTTKRAATTKSSAGKTATTESSTKFVPQGDNYFENAVTEPAGDSAASDGTAAEAGTVPPVSTAKMQDDAILLLIIGVAALLVGGILIAAYGLSDSFTPRPRRRRKKPSGERVTDRLRAEEESKKKAPDAKGETHEGH